MPGQVLTDEIRYRVFKILEADPKISQRALAEALGVSVGKVNYCLRELVRSGFVKIDNFKNNQNKRAYLYCITPAGIAEKAIVSYRFLQRKIGEFEALRAEIETLQQATSRPSTRSTNEEAF